ncbi:hypothetical protein [Ekhidna sp.]|uniref:hypothetical protein n=1 Tax=Ekhidna sp. TaxID=2608089 RepID=UPI003CCB741D
MAILISLSFLKTSAQNFEGRLTYESYSVIEKDTIPSSSSTYWFKDHLEKHTMSVAKAPTINLGTLYSNADNMTRKNMDASGNLEVITPTIDLNMPLLQVEALNEYDTILNFRCQKWKLLDVSNQKLISVLWITDKISNSYYDQFVRLFNYQNTLFPCEGLKGWILKREDYRREGQIFVTEIKDLKKMELSIAEMVIY